MNVKNGYRGTDYINGPRKMGGMREIHTINALNGMIGESGATKMGK